MADRLLLVANPSSQSGRNEARIKSVIERMNARGIDAEFQPTEPDGRTIETLRNKLDAEQGHEIVVYMGGDGTFREVACGILAARRVRKMGMLPAGTANDQGKSFGVSNKPDHLDQNLDTILAGHTIALDAGEIRRRADDGSIDSTDLFFDSAGMGFHPEILAQRNRDRRVVDQIPVVREVYRDQAVYAGAMLQRTLASWVEPMKFDATVTADGGVHRYEQITDLILNNTPIYGGAWVPDRRTNPCDGLLDLVPMSSRRDMVSKVIRDLAVVPIWQEQLDLLGVQHAQGFSAQQFEIDIDRPDRPQVDTQIDGEEWLPGRRFLVSVRKGALPLLVPADFEPPWKER